MHSLDMSMDEAPEESRLKLRLALRAAGIGIWDWNLVSNEMDYSSRAREIYGFPASGPISFEMVRAATHPDDLPRTSSQSRRAIDPEIRDQRPYEYRILRADNGEERWVLAHGEAIFADLDGSPRAIRYLGTIQDISEQKSREQDLRDSATRLQLAIEAANLAVWELDIATDGLKTSPELNRLFGFPEDVEPSIEEFRARYLPGERERMQAAAIAVLKTGQTRFEAEFRIKPADGAPRWLMVRAEVLLNAEGGFERVIGVVMDIDERRRAEERRHLMVRELNHRVKNSLSVVQALAGQTFRDDVAVKDALPVFRARIRALASANDVLVEDEWKGFSLHTLAQRITDPYRQAGSDPFTIEGEDVLLGPNLNVPVALALHELCTNAAKYGALSVPEGRVFISWRSEDAGLVLDWREENGPAVAPPAEEGFGTTLLKQILAREFESVEMNFAPRGMTLRMKLALVPPAARPAA